MRDALEERLASRLGALGETVADELPPPVDLEFQVLYRRRRAKTTRRWAGLSVAAAIVVVAASSVAVVHGTSGHGSIQVESSSTTAAASAAPLDSLQRGTVMLSARGRYVISLDAAGRQNATMVSVKVGGEILYARVTDDHRQIWYLSMKKKNACGDVVRADIDQGNSSTIVTHAAMFDVSPDGSRLALYGAGDLARGGCAPVSATAPGRIVVVDLASGASSATAVGSVTSMRWSPDSSFLVAASCPKSGCEGFHRIDAPARLGATLSAQPLYLYAAAGSPLLDTRFAFAADGLYTLTTSGVGGAGPSVRHVESIYRYDARALDQPALVFGGAGDWDVSQVIPTAAANYVVAAPMVAKGKTRVPGATGLYRIVRRRLVYVRSLAGPGTLTAVAPLAPG
jgi:hypothetical protein